MRHQWTAAGVVAFLILPTAISRPFTGDSMFGTVTAVRSAEVLVFAYDSGRYDVRIVGIIAPRDPGLAREARQFVSNLVLGKRVRLRFEYRASNGQMVSRVFTADSLAPTREVGVELLKAGLARRQAGYDYKYGELAAAENEARGARRGLWASVPPR